jgi:valyl-tRNA synthetase
MTSELDEDLIYDVNMLSKIDLYVKRVEHTLLNVCDIDSSRMDYHFKEFITKCKEYLSKRELSKYINYVKSFTDMYILKEMYNYNQLLLYLIAIYPLMPFLAEEIYEEKFSKKNSIINEGWI